MIAETSSLIVPLVSIVERLDTEKIFPQAQPLEIELGSGDGSFLVRWSEQNPTRNFIGVERLLGRLRKIDRKGRRAGLKNLRVVRIEASYFLEFLVPRKCASAMHVYFPDPWPKRKHRKYRLINSRFTQLASDVLLPSGIVYLRTDDADYFSQMNAVFTADSRFELVETPSALASVLTDFEKGFLARGVQTLSAAYHLKT
jgi:tRNA (guanine-N7-)-methyltransferase